MKTKEIKKQTAFRLNDGLIERLKKEAKKSNRSLNNYVETVLFNSLYKEPNTETIKAIEEARIKQGNNFIDTSSLEKFILSIDE